MNWLLGYKWNKCKEDKYLFISFLSLDVWLYLWKFLATLPEYQSKLNCCFFSYSRWLYCLRVLQNCCIMNTFLCLWYVIAFLKFYSYILSSFSTMLSLSQRIIILSNLCSESILICTYWKLSDKRGPNRLKVSSYKMIFSSIKRGLVLQQSCLIGLTWLNYFIGEIV